MIQLRFRIRSYIQGVNHEWYSGITALGEWYGARPIAVHKYLPQKGWDVPLPWLISLLYGREGHRGPSSRKASLLFVGVRMTQGRETCCQLYYQEQEDHRPHGGPWIAIAVIFIVSGDIHSDGPPRCNPDLAIAIMSGG